ncbi:MAG: hypothetical protein Q8S03_03260 [Brevundimonas sp.]|uniref:hypothetical protein n=1 Tax=Brevundimonas sp. TaxID=1871086 RepID=UPI00273307E1|nr:hypothetical protein [Brevundimonas sp.]MDP3403682.1 hypothetical protein [Brevundimonas sp.]
MDQETRRPKSAPDEVWVEVKDAYLGGASAAECCRRFGVGKSALRARAAREGWRRCDQIWVPPAPLEPWDEGLKLEQEVGGDLDQLDFAELAHVAMRRMMRAVLHGDAAAVMRWHRVRGIMDAMQAEVDAAMEADEAAVFARENQKQRAAWARKVAEDALDNDGPWPPDPPRFVPDHPDHPDNPDTVFESGRARPGTAETGTDLTPAPVLVDP